MERLVIRRPDDWHVHVREGDMIPTALTAYPFARGLVMPNVPAIETGRRAWYYQQSIQHRKPGFNPLMTIKIGQQTMPRIIREASDLGVLAGKVYPADVTTGSEDGIRDFDTLCPVFQAMQDVDMVLSLHGEMPGAYIIDRERAFLRVLKRIVEDFPQLRIVMEHLSTAQAVDCVKDLGDKVAATITAHHLVLTLDDVIGGKCHPHNFCLPVAQSPLDREALLMAATSGDEKFFFGSDSAPHPIINKECSSGAGGIFSGPVALPLLAQVFEERNALPDLEDFVSLFGAEFYGIPLNEGQIVLERQNWVVPGRYGNVVPFMAGETLSWQVVDA